MRGGEFPYWNPYFGAGQPLAANPEHEVFYPLTWLILLPSYRVAFHLLTLIHLYIAAFTMYALLRSMRVRPEAAFFGALSYAIGGIAVSYLNLLPYLFTAAWLPLTCLYTRRFLLHRAWRDCASSAPRTYRASPHPTSIPRRPTRSWATCSFATCARRARSGSPARWRPTPRPYGRTCRC